MPTSRCDLKVILLCNGRGADAASYRPNRDESQWWSRRDALVRCVSSFLFGPSPSTGKKELTFLFDDDLARIHMTRDEKCTVIPTEQWILSLWKQAAQNLNETIHREGMICRIEFDLATTINNDNKKGWSLPTGLDSKRQVLEYLQRHCSMDFLRSKGLNSNPDVILRKTNKKALMQVLHDWRKSLTQDDQHSDDVIESIYSRFLQPPQNDDSNRSEGIEIVAGTLHETCDEFPCFGLQHDSLKKHLRVCLFLGAVRDMTAKENDILKRVCKRSSTPLVGIRFGSVPEFTSKILSVLAYHHSHDIVGGSIQRLLRSEKVDFPLSPKQTSSLHVLCAVPLSTHQLTLDLKDRDRVHWCLVRVIVCALWRSRLVSSKALSFHSNSIHFVFSDGATIDLLEDEFVAHLASQHQAAPCEFQIINALKKKLKDVTPPEKEWSRKKLATKILKNIISSSSLPIGVAVAIEPGKSRYLSERFYSSDPTSGAAGKAILTLLDIGHEPLGRVQKASKMYKSFLSASKKLDIPLLHQSFIEGGCQDYEAATIIAIQHFCYQNRIFTKQKGARKKVDKKRKYEAVK